jgi:hypothetical protein
MNFSITLMPGSLILNLIQIVVYKYTTSFQLGAFFRAILFNFGANAVGLLKEWYLF